MQHVIITLFYVLPSLFLSSIGVVVLVHLPKFHTSSLGVSLVVVSFALFSSRIWDAVTDPLIGYLSDRVSHPFFRRPFWVVLGGVGTAASFLWLTNTTLMNWGGIGLLNYSFLYLFFFLAYTVVLIPYESWALELGLDERFRTKIILLREGGALLGTLIAGALPVFLFQISHSAESAFFSLGWILGGGLIVSTFGLIIFVPRPVSKDIGQNALGKGEPKSPFSLYQNFFAVLQTPGFLLLLLAFSLTTIAAQIPAALILFYIEFVLHLPNPFLYVLLYFIGAVAAFPLWLWAVKYKKKGDLWFLGLLINTGAFLLVLFIPAGGALAFGIASLLSGLGLGGVVAIPTALGADLIEHEQCRSGVRQEGSFVGVWNIVRKLSAALGVAGVLFALHNLGFQPEEGSVKISEPVIWWLTFFYCGLPCLLNGAAMWVVYLFKEKFQFQ